jgi:hypothetical protein
MVSELEALLAPAAVADRLVLELCRMPEWIVIVDAPSQAG